MQGPLQKTGSHLPAIYRCLRRRPADILPNRIVLSTVLLALLLMGEWATCRPVSGQDSSRFGAEVIPGGQANHYFPREIRPLPATGDSPSVVASSSLVQRKSSQNARKYNDTRLAGPLPRIPEVMNPDSGRFAQNNFAQDNFDQTAALQNAGKPAPAPPFDSRGSALEKQVANDQGVGLASAAHPIGAREQTWNAPSAALSEPGELPSVTAFTQGLQVSGSGRQDPGLPGTYAMSETSGNKQPLSVIDQLYGPAPDNGRAIQQSASPGETFLELPSNLVMADGSAPHLQQTRGREQFWDQFSAYPEGDKKQRTEGYESVGAILSNGFWFGGADVFFIEPMFGENPAMLVESGGMVRPLSADFGFDTAIKVHAGFETNAGPGVRFSFFRYNDETGVQNFVSDGTSVGQVRLLFDGGAGAIRLIANNSGDAITTRQQIKIRSSEVNFYKDQKNEVSRVRGSVGIRHLILQQVMDAELVPAAGLPQRFRSFNDFQAIGPKLGIDYFRPVGHTDLELQSGMAGSLLFGRRDHSVAAFNATGYQSDGKSEALPILEMYIGLQWNIELSECQTAFLRTALESQYWANSDTPSETDANSGFYGLSVGIGITR